MSGTEKLGKSRVVGVNACKDYYLIARQSLYFLSISVFRTKFLSYEFLQLKQQEAMTKMEQFQEMRAADHRDTGVRELWLTLSLVLLLLLSKI